VRLSFSSQRPLRSNSGGNWLTSLAVATTNTGAVFSAIQEMKEPKTRAEASSSVIPELLLPANPLSISSSHSTQGEPSCCVNYHYKIDLAITLANLSYRLGRSVHFDGVAEKIVGDPEAARLARPVYRAPWRFPSEYLTPS
jgi:hypothetical protein